MTESSPPESSTPHQVGPAPSSESAANRTGSTEWTEQQLPPVKPPTAGLLMQLFFVPMIIVSIIVAVWLTFGWIAQSGVKPEQLAADLQRMNQGSWQKALQLANMLRDPRNTELRQNEALAQQLVDTLDLMLEDQSFEVGSDRQLLALWLASALGEFEVPTGLDSLIQAAEAEDMQVRTASVKSIGMLVNRTGDAIDRESADLLDALENAGSEMTEVDSQLAEHAILRSSAAYTLGLLGGSPAIEQLSLMLSDPHPDVRYNAATGLARNGDSRCVPRLVEMLSRDNAEAVRHESENATSREWKQAAVQKTALEATLAFLNRVPQPDPADAKLLSVAVDDLLAWDDLKMPLRMGAEETQRQLKKVLSTASASK